MNRRFQHIRMGAWRTARSSGFLVIIIVAAGWHGPMRGWGRQTEGSQLYDQDHGRSGAVARGQYNRDGPAGHRSGREEASGKLRASITSEAYTVAGTSTVFCHPEKGPCRAGEVPDIWYQVRKKIGEHKANIFRKAFVGPFFKRRNSARTYGRHLRIHCRWLHATGSCAIMWRPPPPGSLRSATYRNRFYRPTG